MMARGSWSRGVVALMAAWTLGACAPATVRQADVDLALPPSEPAFAVAGTVESDIERGSLWSPFGCEVRYEVHRPVGWDGGATVVLAHGFLRDLRTMRGWAAHLASHGVATAVVSFCNSRLFDGRHDRNAVDLRALADTLQAPDGPVLYVGFSAGGLAALLAAADDPRTVAYLGLDAVDSGGLATRATGLAAPALFLLAEPDACNAQASMAPVAATIAAARLVRIPYATHCHFEDPYAPLCERLCGRVEPQEAADAIRATIRSLATAWILKHAGGL
jgi:pimeloyl-ACP methyl ester carboxylesterase